MKVCAHNRYDMILNYERGGRGRFLIGSAGIADISDIYEWMLSWKFQQSGSNHSQKRINRDKQGGQDETTIA